MHEIDITNQQSSLSVDVARMRRAAEAILRDAQIQRATISIAIVDDATIHGLNRQFLQHDYPTDVLSFVLENGPGEIEGEVIVSADTAERSAVEFGWSADDELLLYAIHGMLHLIGYDDQSPDARARIRSGEARYLALVGLELRGNPLASKALSKE